MTLTVCAKCGWYDGHTHAYECDPQLGARADEFARGFPGITATKLGYGYGRLTFNLGQDMSVTFAISKRGHHRLDHVHWLRGDHAALLRGLIAASGGGR